MFPSVWLGASTCGLWLLYAYAASLVWRSWRGNNWTRVGWLVSAALGLIFPTLMSMPAVVDSAGTNGWVSPLSPVFAWACVVMSAFSMLTTIAVIKSAATAPADLRRAEIFSMRKMLHGRE